MDSGGSIVALGGLPDTGMTRDETVVVQAISSRLRGSDRVTIVQNVPEVIPAVNSFSDADVLLNNPCRELFYLHYQKDGRDIYFISNSLDEAIQREITLKCAGKAQIWHPTTGEMHPVDCRIECDGTTINLNLDAFEAVFIVIEKGKGE